MVRDSALVCVEDHRSAENAGPVITKKSCHPDRSKRTRAQWRDLLFAKIFRPPCASRLGYFFLLFDLLVDFFAGFFAGFAAGLAARL
jgi:hypothetical protein